MASHEDASEGLPSPEPSAVQVRVVIDAPQHAALAPVLTYVHDRPLQPGTLVRVPLGRRTVPGLVWHPEQDGAGLPAGLIRPVQECLDAVPALGERWLDLIRFAADYYQRNLGELALNVLPPELRKLDAASVASRVSRYQKRRDKQVVRMSGAADVSVPLTAVPELTGEQAAVLAAWDFSGDALTSGQRPGCHLLHGVTGSGKTEVYLRLAARELAAGRQVLVLVPEINLTPQLEQRFAARFPGRTLVSLHSGLTPAQRLQHWLAAHLGDADLILGTRLAVFASLPRLGLIVVDEEHDASYKQQDGARYSARDLAVYRGWQEAVPVLLGSATPSLETWHQVQRGRYRLHTMAMRVGLGALPRLRVVDMRKQPVPQAGTEAPPLSAPLLAAIQSRLDRGEQSLLFLNRRGFAPVLQCGACGWKSGCPHCSAWRVFHKQDRTLRCHHCSLTERVPVACPDCGNLDIQPVGRGTERLEEQLAQVLPGARLARIDADSTRLKGSLEQQLAAIHAGEVDIVIGTQMITKGHDFRRVTLVAAVNPDSALFTPDFRGPERLFSTLLQASGRAGRDARHAEHSEMWVQTWCPEHSLFAALEAHDYVSFARAQLAEREMAGLPPFGHLALLRTEGRSAEVAEEFLRQAREWGLHLLQGWEGPAIRVYAPVPPAIARVAGFERRQMLVESDHRVGLQRFLAHWLLGLHELRAVTRGVVRWAIDVDPQTI